MNLNNKCLRMQLNAEQIKTSTRKVFTFEIVHFTHFIIYLYYISQLVPVPKILLSL